MKRFIQSNILLLFLVCIFFTILFCSCKKKTVKIGEDGRPSVGDIRSFDGYADSNISIRDHFACEALNSCNNDRLSATDVAKRAYNIADAMLVERGK